LAIQVRNDATIDRRMFTLQTSVHVLFQQRIAADRRTFLAQLRA